MKLLLSRIKTVLYRFRVVQNLVHPFAVRRYLRTWARTGPAVKGRPDRTVVLLNHCYDQDIDAICRAAGAGETVWVLESSRVFKIIHKFIPPALSGKNLSNEDPAMRPLIETYRREFVVPLADWLVKTTGLGVFVTPSDIFFWLRPLIDELKRRGVRIVVQDKEGTICPGPIMDDFSDFIKQRFPPISDRYFFWNRTHEAFAMRTGVRKELSTIVGQPRSDYFFHQDRWPSRAELDIPADARVILFFIYAADVYLTNGVEEESVGRPWRQLRTETLRTLAAVSRRFPDSYLIVKAHPQQNDLWETQDEFNALNIPRARFETGAHSANAFITNADIIVGFQTTAMIEAMLTPKPVIYTGWGSDHECKLVDLLPIPQSGGCDVPADAKALDSLLSGYLGGTGASSEAQLARRRGFTEEYFHAADGSVSRRFLDLLWTGDAAGQTR